MVNALNTYQTDYPGFIYAFLLAVGALMGARKGSIMSLIMGGGSAALAAYGAHRVSQDRHDIYLSLAVCWSLAVIMGIRFARRWKFMPAGLILILSVFLGTYYTLLIVPDAHHIGGDL